MECLFDETGTLEFESVFERYRLLKEGSALILTLFLLLNNEPLRASCPCLTMFVG